MRPYTLIAELTYRCPLRCAYCSNPVDLAAHASELTTEEWTRIFTEAEDLGVVQMHLTGGEPLARADLETLVTRAHELGLFTNLITSAVPLSRERLRALKAAGLDAVQVSVQDTDAAGADAIAGYAASAQKRAAIRWVKDEGLPLTLNVVLHRRNLDHVEALVAMAEEAGADRLELANTQYLGWAHANRAALMPSREQLDRAHAVAARAKERLRGKMEVLFVKPDYFESYPKACMDGWARRFVHVAPDGRVYPCHAAMAITSLAFESARAKPLAWIWKESPAMNAYRGDAWMKEPCRSCERKSVDFGGCRCQAFLATGDAARADPACARSEDHGLIEAARRTTGEERVEPRRFLMRGRGGG